MAMTARVTAAGAGRVRNGNETKSDDSEECEASFHDFMEYDFMVLSRFCMNRRRNWWVFAALVSTGTASRRYRWQKDFLNKRTRRSSWLFSSVIMAGLKPLFSANSLQA